jgi:uncharacterized protein YdeI (YjbR/CyaY-like superfamily)
MANGAARREEVLGFRTPRQWAAWLAKNHARATGVWLRFARDARRSGAFSHEQALDAALCWGWIDGRVKKLDDATWTQWFGPRRPRSIWSKINREKAAKLIEEGKMKAPGLEAVESARRDGRWQAAYDSPARASVPPDLRLALDASPRAAASFANLDSRNRYAILFRTHNARRPETRAKRIAAFVAMLERGEKIHP